VSFRSRDKRPLHSWAVWTLIEEHLSDPTNTDFVRTYVDSPGAVGVVVLHVDSMKALKGMSMHDVDITLVSQYRAAFSQVMWEIPAGMRDVEGEPPQETAIRELAEEAGLSANEMQYLGMMASAPGLTNSTVEIYAAAGLSDVPISRHGPEELHMEVRRLSVHDALIEIRNGLIIDSKTIIGVQWAAELF
jgi:8-oxo-dGTP pyrophosphatase MutT (NUDIX family)